MNLSHSVPGADPWPRRASRQHRFNCLGRHACDYRDYYAHSARLARSDSQISALVVIARCRSSSSLRACVAQKHSSTSSKLDSVTVRRLLTTIQLGHAGAKCTAVRPTTEIDSDLLWLLTGAMRATLYAKKSMQAPSRGIGGLDSVQPEARPLAVGPAHRAERESTQVIECHPERESTSREHEQRTDSSSTQGTEHTRAEYRANHKCRSYLPGDMPPRRRKDGCTVQDCAVDTYIATGLRSDTATVQLPA
ncbi:hypothetical protein BC834DRAFT_310374 [Gloeopeniophorella convolvens]|nr:hypothetical protein BC834DRAFT_310374 [Gloeopeniophorella convolvens]